MKFNYNLALNNSPQPSILLVHKQSIPCEHQWPCPDFIDFSTFFSKPHNWILSCAKMRCQQIIVKNNSNHFNNKHSIIKIRNRDNIQTLNWTSTQYAFQLQLTGKCLSLKANCCLTYQYCTSFLIKSLNSTKSMNH